MIIQNEKYKILGAFVKLRKATISFVTAVSPSVRPHGTTLFSMDGFSLNLMFDYSLQNPLRNFKFH